MSEKTDTSATPEPRNPTPVRVRRSRKPRVPRTPRGPRSPHKLVVGNYGLDGVTFTPQPTQPETPMTEVVDLVAWAQKNLQPGEFDVIRVLPGKLTVAKQETFKALFAETK